MTPQEQAQRGDEAARLMESQVLKDAFAGLEQEYTELWKQTKASDEAAREKLWLSLRQLQMVQAQLNGMIQTGKVAKATLAQRAKQALSEAGNRLWRD
jgi:hypothetical protein